MWRMAIGRIIGLWLICKLLEGGMVGRLHFLIYNCGFRLDECCDVIERRGMSWVVSADGGYAAKKICGSI
jgi:hypothetical protein